METKEMIREKLEEMIGEKIEVIVTSKEIAEKKEDINSINVFLPYVLKSERDVKNLVDSILDTDVDTASEEILNTCELALYEVVNDYQWDILDAVARKTVGFEAFEDMDVDDRSELIDYVVERTIVTIDVEEIAKSIGLVVIDGFVRNVHVGCIKKTMDLLHEYTFCEPKVESVGEAIKITLKDGGVMQWQDGQKMLDCIKTWLTETKTFFQKEVKTCVEGDLIPTGRELVLNDKTILKIIKQTIEEMIMESEKNAK